MAKALLDVTLRPLEPLLELWKCPFVKGQGTSGGPKTPDYKGNVEIRASANFGDFNADC